MVLAWVKETNAFGSIGDLVAELGGLDLIDDHADHLAFLAGIAAHRIDDGGRMVHVFVDVFLNLLKMIGDDIHDDEGVGVDIDILHHATAQAKAAKMPTNPWIVSFMQIMPMRISDASMMKPETSSFISLCLAMMKETMSKPPVEPLPKIRHGHAGAGQSAAEDAGQHQIRVDISLGGVIDDKQSIDA
jgi:hypothetical protein